MKQSRITNTIVKYTFYGIETNKYPIILKNIKGYKKVDDENGAEEYWIEATIPNIQFLLNNKCISETTANALKKTVKSLDNIVVYI